MSVISRYLSYYTKAITTYQVHSPKVYSFITEVMDQQRQYYKFDEIEYLRAQYLKSNDNIPFVELGAGSKKENGETRSIARIAKYALSPQKTCRILFNTVKHYQCKNSLELGTSLGISSAYMAAVNKDYNVYTIEGNPACAEIAKHNHQQLQLANIEVITGPFEDYLIPTLDKMNTVDLVYLDGNHSYEATMKYFHTIIPYLHENSVVILDDIYWSDDMLRAWNEVRSLSSVSCSIDIYSSGFVFFNKDMKQKQDFTLIDNKLKPWQVGLFSTVKSPTE